jgi:hypothetical protein
MENLDKIWQIAIVTFLFLTASEGFRLWDKRLPNRAKSHIWHTFGSIVRMFIVGIFYQATQSYLLTIAFGIPAIVIYSAVCAYANGLKHWYSLSDKGIDLIIRKVLFFINFD